MLVAALVLLACEKPGASHTTSPSAKALLGTTTGNVFFDLPDAAPADIPDPEGWRVRLENARFSQLEDGAQAIQVVLSIRSRPGPGFEIWFSDRQRTVLRWSGGSARTYDGVVCFQLRLEADGEALPLGPGPHTMTIAFREPAAESVLVARTQRVAGFAPGLSGGPPGPQSKVARQLLGCPRSVI